jgi:hypothetical protein
MITTPDGVAIYSQDEVDVLHKRINEQYTLGITHGKTATSNELQDKAINHFRSEVREGNLSSDTALEIYNSLAEALGWNTVDSLAILFTVMVSYNGNTIAEIENIEAEDCDSAEAEVRYNLEVEDVDVSFTIAYNGTSYNDTVNTTYEFDDEFEYQAIEQD